MEKLKLKPKKKKKISDDTMVEQTTENAYDPYFLDDDTYGKYGLDPSSLVKIKLN